MVVKPIEFGMIQQQNNVSSMQRESDMKPVAEQQNISVQVQKENQQKSEQVTQKDNADNQNGKYDAKDKSSNEYYSDKDGSNNSKSKSDGRVFIKGQGSMDFDIKV